MVDKRNSEKKEKIFKVKWIYQSIGISKQAYSQRLKADLIRNSEKEKSLIVLLNIGKNWQKQALVNFNQIFNKKWSTYFGIRQRHFTDNNSKIRIEKIE